MTGQTLIQTTDTRRTTPGRVFLFAGVLGLAGFLAGCAGTDVAPAPVTPVNSVSSTGYTPVYSSTASRRRTAGASTAGNLSSPAEWRTVRRSVTIDSPPAAVATQPAPYVAPRPAQPMTRAVSAAVPSSAPSVSDIAKMPLDSTAPKSYAEWSGPLPTPDLGRIESLKREERSAADQLASLQGQRRRAIKSGGSTDTNRSAIKSALERRRSAVGLLVALEGYRDNPTRTAQIRYAKSLQRYNKAR